MQRSKTYRAAAETFDKDELYAPLAAIKIAKGGSKKKFDETLDVVMRLGVDPRKADQMVRGTVNLPHGTGKTARVLVFANADKADAAREAGAEFVGGDELIEKVAGGWLDFDAVVATPDMMGKVGRLGRVLGPRSLMPNPKTGTVTPDVAKAVTDIKGGKIEFRVDRHSNLHFIIGKASFSEAQLAENYAAALEEVLRLKPASSKGRYIKKITVSTTMGPGIQVDPNRVKNVASEDEALRPEPDCLARSPHRGRPSLGTAGPRRLRPFGCGAMGAVSGHAEPASHNRVHVPGDTHARHATRPPPRLRRPGAHAGSRPRRVQRRLRRSTATDEGVGRHRRRAPTTARRPTTGAEATDAEEPARGLAGGALRRRVLPRGHGGAARGGDLRFRAPPPTSPGQTLRR